MKKLLLWGTGNIARRVVLNGLEGDLIGFIQTVKTDVRFWEKEVYDACHLPLDYDYIIVANSYVNEIFDICKKININLSRVIFLKPVRGQEEILDLSIIRSVLGEANYTYYCSERGIFQGTFFYDDMERYNKLNRRENFYIDENNLYPIISDKYSFAGSMNNYFWQDLWAAKLIYKSGAKEHTDIGSRIDGFIAHLLAMDIKVSLIDIREFPGKVENLHTIVDDATDLTQIPDESIESMSALCSLEHFGLGRYGDPIDPEACFKCFAQIQRKMKTGGALYISVPVGKERVEFNAHRVFYASTIIACFSDMMLQEFSCTAQGKLECNVNVHKYDDDEHQGDYRYGLFCFIKK